MHCMSCKQEMGMEGKIFQHLLVCPGCKELADKAEREITREIERAKGHALNWLEAHIMRGGLLSGGSGTGGPTVAETARGILSDHSPVPQVRGEEADRNRRGGDSEDRNPSSSG